jgi:exodeoxyribonuclease-5
MVDFSKSSRPKKVDRKEVLGLFNIGFESHNAPLSNSLEKIEFNDEQIEGLNKEQADMVINITKYLNGELDLPYYLVQGSGGTGKSFSIYRAIMNVPSHLIIAAAPSHFAKNVLQDFLGEDYLVKTIAGLLGKKVTYNDEGKEILVPIFRLVPPITKYPVIIIDEGSMVDDDTYDEILTYVKDAGKKLIVLGDYCQLPPVNQAHDSLFFDDISSELLQPMRFTGPIYDLATFVRDEIVHIREGTVPRLNVLNIKTDRISMIDDRGSGYIFLNNMGTLLKAAIRRFKSGKGASYARVVAYRNKTIDKINHHIRKGLYGETPKQFEVGELLINNGGFSVPKGRRKKQIISNGSIFEVEKATPVLGPYDIPCMSLEFKNAYFENKIITVSKEGMEMFNRIESRIKRIAKNDKAYWKDYFSFRESFAYFSYSYASSSHKVQGSSISHVFILEDDIYSVRPTTPKEKLQSLYVSITRASFRTYVYHKEFDVNNTQLDRELLKLDYDSDI